MAATIVTGVNWPTRSVNGSVFSIRGTAGGPQVALTGVPRARLAWAAGFDVCEFSPIEGLHHPNFTMARLVYKLIGYVWLSRGGA